MLKDHGEVTKPEKISANEGWEATRSQKADRGEESTNEKLIRKEKENWETESRILQ